MRDRLIELLRDTFNYTKGVCIDFDEAVEINADHLLENGVIVSPVKVGDTLWKIEDILHLDDIETWTYHYEKEVIEFMVRSISISCNSKGVWTRKFRICEVKNGKTIDRQRNIEFDEFGKTVFLTREEAEKALAEGSENGTKTSN